MQWNSKRLDRILVDHLLRDGRYETADEIVKVSPNGKAEGPRGGGGVGV